VRLQLEGTPLRLCERDHLGETEQDFGDAERVVDLVAGANMAIRRAAIEKVGLFNEALSGYGDEGEWEFRLRSAGGVILYIPSAWVWHRRTAVDLQLWRLLRKQFRRGSEQPAYAKLIGERLSIGQNLVAIPRFLAHAIRRRCAGGLLSASVRAGRVWGLTRQRTSITLSSFKSLAARFLSLAGFEDH
jgi:GT2 family glycosyltransferase